MCIENKLKLAEDIIDEAILKWIGKRVVVTDPTSDTFIKGELIAYDGGRIFVKKADSNVIDGSEIVCLLNGAMTISLIDGKDTQGKIINLYKDSSKVEPKCFNRDINNLCEELEKEISSIEPAFAQVIDEDFWDLLGNSKNKEKGQE